MSEETGAATTAASKRPRKLGKEIKGTVVIITELDTKSTLQFDFTKLPKEIQEKFGPYGLSQKLGDSAAGKTGKDAIESINKVWDGLMKNDWSIRAPAGEKITKSSVLDKFNAMPEGKAKEQAKAALIALGLMSA